MNHPFDLDNFESFLSEQADQHRMYAGDRVWRNIQEKLHGKDRWPALTFGAILTTSIIAVVLTFTYPQKRLYNSPADYTGITANHQSLVSIEPQNDPKVQQEYAKADKSLVLNTLNKPAQHASKSEELTAENIENGTTGGFSANSLAQTPLNGNPATISTNTFSSTHETKEATTLVQASEMGYAHVDAEMIDGNKSLIARSTENGPTFAQIESNNHSIKADDARVETQNALGEAMAGENFTKTSLAYGPQKPGKAITSKNRWLMEFYATPSISYRYLLEDKKFMDNPSAANGPLAPYLTNPVTDFINQKPKLGLEIGTAFIYQLTDNFRLKTGIQANYRQFGIQAFATAAEPAMLTLNRDNGVDSIIRFSSISTQSGYKSIELSSNFLQLAIPLGFDLKFADTRKVDFYVSAAGQFTYQLASSNYILSSDYKHYLKQPDLARRFNINTAVEAFASFDAGGITWQAGPQIRYQLLPGSKDAYPIREHLIDYGFKVGVVKRLK